MDFVSFLGRLHPVVLHLPIGALFTLVVVEIWLVRSKQHKDLSLLLALYAFATLTVILAVATGLILHEEDVYGGSTLDLHEKLGIATGVAILIITGFAWQAVRRSKKQVTKNNWVTARRFGLLITVALVTLAGHFGGELTHGKGFLFEYGPAFLQEKEELEPIEITADTTVFEASIYPVLHSYCVYCHDDETTKGKLRMDSPEAMLAGGSSGELFIPGDVENSLMLQRIHLPMDDEEHMPPSNKRQPGEEDIAALVWWIESGASFEMKLNDDQVPESVRSLVVAQEKDEGAPVLEGNLDLEAVQDLRDQLLTIQRIQQDDKRLWINFSAIATSAGDEFLEQLRPLSNFIVWLDLSRTQITDASMPLIAEMQNLEELNLHSCEISDQGLEQLKGLGNLKKLNLTGTMVSELSLPILLEIESLEILHLFHSQWSPEGVKVLRTLRPDLTVNVGE